MGVGVCACVRACVWVRVLACVVCVFSAIKHTKTTCSQCTSYTLCSSEVCKEMEVYRFMLNSKAINLVANFLDLSHGGQVALILDCDCFKLIIRHTVIKMWQDRF